MKKNLLVQASLLFVCCWLLTACGDQTWKQYDHPVLRNYFRDSLEAMDLRSADILSAAYMTDRCLGENTEIPGWEGFPVKLYEYHTGVDVKIHRPKKGLVYLLNPSPRQLSMWIVNAVFEATDTVRFEDIHRLSNFIKWQSGAQFPVKGVVYEDMYVKNHYRPYIFKDGVTVYIADSTHFPKDSTCTEEHLQFYLNMSNADLKPRTGRYARICSTTREMYYEAGGTAQVGSEADRNHAWLDEVARLYQEAWYSDRNELITAWAKYYLSGKREYPF